MNQGKLEVVKQEMAKVNTNIFRISELKWMGMGEFNSDDHYIYYCGHEASFGGHRKAAIVRGSRELMASCFSFSASTVAFFLTYLPTAEAGRQGEGEK